MMKVIASKYYSVFTMGVMVFLWGLWLLAPWDTFAYSPAFDFMALVSPEEGWGAVMVGIGTFTMLAATRFHHTVATACLACGFIWGAIVFSIAKITLTSTGIPTYSVLCIWSFLAYVRVISLSEGDSK